MTRRRRRSNRPACTRYKPQRTQRTQRETAGAERQGKIGGVQKQKGIALLRCPPAPLVWLPQQFTAPCRNQTSDLSAREGNGHARDFARNIDESWAGRVPPNT